MGILRQITFSILILIGATSGQRPLVRFNQDGSLKIVQFTDLHYGDRPAGVGPENDFNSTQVMRDILDWEHPDFVIFTGDQLNGDVLFPNATEYVHMLLKPVVEKSYRWASVYGNHDIGINLKRLDILKAEQTYGELCYTTQMNPSLPGVTNYYIPVYAPQNATNSSSANENEKPVMIWWFLDSQGGWNLAGRQPYYIDQAVVNWFRNESRRMEAEWGLLPSLMFFHIPTIEYVGIQERISDNPLCSGLVDDKVTPQEKDTGIMEAMLENGGVRTIFVGHEHGNSWCCYHKTIEVCYNRHTGYNGYGSWDRGARVIKLDYAHLSNQTNYVRLENGSITDVFPPT